MADQPWDAVDLCTGGGLFAEAAARVGVNLRLCIDIDTYGKKNRPLKAVETSQAAGHPAVAGDIGDLSLYAELAEERARLGADAPPLLLFGGPPCQPFSTAGKRAGAGDARDAFPAALEAIDLLQPRRAVLENVRGILSHRGKCPGKKRGEAELQADAVDYETAMGLNCPACYLHRHLIPEMRKRFPFAGYWLLDAADFGVPQRRWRVFMWGAEIDLGAGPRATHSAEALVYAKWVSGSYWAEHGLDVGGDGLVAEMHRSRRGPGNGTQAEATSTDEPSVTLSGAAGGSTRPQLTDRGYPTPIAKWEERLLKKIQAGQVDPARLQLQRWRTMRDALPALQARAMEGYFMDSGRNNAIGGGRNPGRGSPNSPRSFRELADEPSPVMTAVQVGNRGPWLATHCGDQKHASKRHPDTTVGEPCRAIRSGGSGNDAPKLQLKRIPREPERLDAPAPTVATTEEKGTRASKASGWKMNGGPDRASDAAWLATNRRRLSPEECALLQSAPPDYPWQGNKTQRYRQIGNAVPLHLGAAVIQAVTATIEDDMTDKTAPPTQPVYMQELVTNLKGMTRRVELGRLTLLMGPCYSGKTSLVQALELLCTGRASDVNGRDPKAKQELAQLIPGLQGELSIVGTLSNGEKLSWALTAADGKLDGPRASAPPWWNMETALPARATYAAMLGSADTARAHLLTYAALNISDADVRRRIAPDQAADYNKLAISIQAVNPLERLQKVREAAAQRKRDARAEARAGSKAAAIVAPSEAEPTDAQVQTLAVASQQAAATMVELRERFRSQPAAAPAPVERPTAEQVTWARGAVQQHAHYLTNKGDWEAQWQGAIDQWRYMVEQAELQVQASEKAALEEPEAPQAPEVAQVLGAARGLLDIQLGRGMETECLLCGTQLPAGHLQGRHAKLSEWIDARMEGHRAAMEAHRAKVATWRNEGKAEHERLIQALKEARKGLRHIEEQYRVQYVDACALIVSNAEKAAAILEAAEAPAVESPEETAEAVSAEELQAAEAAAAQAAAALRAAQQLQADWAKVRGARHMGADHQKDSDRWKALETACKQVEAELLQASMTGFLEAAGSYAPAGWTLGLSSSMRIGWWKQEQDGAYVHCEDTADYAFLATAISGAEWAIAMACMSAACTDPSQPFALVIPEDRAWDPDTLRDALKGFESMPKHLQIVVTSTIKPRRKPSTKWTVVDVTELKVDPAPVVG